MAENRGHLRDWKNGQKLKNFVNIFFVAILSTQVLRFREISNDQSFQTIDHWLISNRFESRTTLQQWNSFHWQASIRSNEIPASYLLRPASGIVGKPETDNRKRPTRLVTFSRAVWKIPTIIRGSYIRNASLENPGWSASLESHVKSLWNRCEIEFLPLPLTLRERVCFVQKRHGKIQMVAIVSRIESWRYIYSNWTSKFDEKVKKNKLYCRW